MLGDAFNRLIWNNPDKYPYTDRSKTVLLAGDFSGSHRRSGFQSYSFVVLDLERNQAWRQAQDAFRKTILQDRRRMSYKSLNDSRRRGALFNFLDIADKIEGWIVSFCITRRSRSLFKNDDASQERDALLGIWKPNVLEQAFRILHLSAFLLTGLSRPGQDLLWIIDEDDIAANQNQLNTLTTVFGNVWSNYADHSLHRIRCGTTTVDDGSMAIEDLAAIPDIVAGALSEISSAMSRDRQMPVLDVLTPFPKGLNEKAKCVAAWLAKKEAPLQRVTCFIQASEEGQRFKMSANMVRWHAVPSKIMTAF
jgi:hypothetical protein